MVISNVFVQLKTSNNINISAVNGIWVVLTRNVLDIIFLNFLVPDKFSLH